MHNLSLRSSNGCKARARGVTHCEAISTRVLRALLLRLRAVSLGLCASWFLSLLGRHSWPMVSMVSAVADQSTVRQLPSQPCRRTQHRARQNLLSDVAVGVVLGAADADAIDEAVGATNSETVGGSWLRQLVKPMVRQLARRWRSSW